MKKSLSLFIIAALCCSLLASCANTATTVSAKQTGNTTAQTIKPLSLPAYESYICGEGNAPGYAGSEKDWWSGIDEYETLPNTRLEVKNNDTNINVTYKKTYKAIGDIYTRRTYEDSKGNFKYYTEAETGNFTGFFYGIEPMREQDSLPDIENFDTEVLNIADKYASEYIDISKYVRTVEDESEFYTIYENTKIIKITYTKYYGDIPTNDTVTIVITSKGFIKSIHLDNNGAFDSLTREIDMEKVEASVTEKVKASYNMPYISHTVDDQYLGFSPDGDLLVITLVEARYETGNAEYPVLYTGLVIVTAV